jgi:hypothetical protein
MGQLECAHAALVIFPMTQPNPFVKPDDIIVDSKSCARIPGCGIFVRDDAYQLLPVRTDVEMFGKLFYEVRFELWFNTLHIENLHHRSILMLTCQNMATK